MGTTSVSEALTITSFPCGVYSGFTWQVADIWGFTLFNEAVILHLTYLRLSNLFFLFLFNSKKTEDSREDNRNGTVFLSNCDLTICHLFEVVGVLFFGF